MTRSGEQKRAARRGWYDRGDGLYAWGKGFVRAWVRFDGRHASYTASSVFITLHGFMYLSDAMLAAEKTYGMTLKPKARTPRATAVKPSRKRRGSLKRKER